MTFRAAISKAPGRPSNVARQSALTTSQSSCQPASSGLNVVPDPEPKEWAAGAGSNWSFGAVSVRSPQRSLPVEREFESGNGVLQRKCAACEKEEEKVSRKALDGPAASDGAKAAPIVNAALTESGRPLS